MVNTHQEILMTQKVPSVISGLEREIIPVRQTSAWNKACIVLEKTCIGVSVNSCLEASVPEVV